MIWFEITKTSCASKSGTGSSIIHRSDVCHTPEVKKDVRKEG